MYRPLSLPFSSTVENAATRQLVGESGTQIVGKYPAENRPRARRSFVINVRARFDAEAEPGRSVFLPRITIEAGGITRWVTKKAKLPVLTHDDSKQWSDKTRFNGEKRAGPVIKGSVSITNTGRDWERGKKGKKGRERNYARYYPLFLRVEEKKRSLMRNSLAVGNSFYFAINAISVGLVIYLRAEDFVDEARL